MIVDNYALDPLIGFFKWDRFASTDLEHSACGLNAPKTIDTCSLIRFNGFLFWGNMDLGRKVS